MTAHLILLLLLPAGLFGQSLTGTWIGRETGAAYLKLVIIQKGDSCFGYTYDEGPGFCKANFAGRFDTETQRLKGKGTSFIERSPDHVLAFYSLNYIKEDGDEWLEGKVGTTGVAGALLSLAMPGLAQLKKISEKIDTTGYMAEKAIGLPRTDHGSTGGGWSCRRAGRKARRYSEGTHSRASKTLSTIETDADTIKMMLFDNGVVDDDTVTVLFDGRVVLDHYRITDTAKELYIPLIKNGRAHEVELFADNLGSIPPNTALIVVMAGNRRYELHASYDLSTNAKIIIRYKE
jgi:hypothetical protein